jgi:hypothetical protein
MEDSWKLKVITSMEFDEEFSKGASERFEELISGIAQGL